MRLNESIVVAARPQLVWDYIADPANALHFMSGITRWEVEGETRIGLGARYRMLMRVGSAEMGGLVEQADRQPDDDGRRDHPDQQADLLRARGRADEEAGLEILGGRPAIAGGDADDAGDRQRGQRVGL